MQLMTPKVPVVRVALKDSGQERDANYTPSSSSGASSLSPRATSRQSRQSRQSPSSRYSPTPRSQLRALTPRVPSRQDSRSSQEPTQHVETLGAHFPIITPGPTEVSGDEAMMTWQMTEGTVATWPPAVRELFSAVDARGKRMRRTTNGALFRELARGRRSAVIQGASASTPLPPVSSGKRGWASSASLGAASWRAQRGGKEARTHASRSETRRSSAGFRPKGSPGSPWGRGGQLDRRCASSPALLGARGASSRAATAQA